MSKTSEPTRTRYFITFTKEGALRYCGQLDLQRTFERTFRRARLPIAYSQGFHPHPKMNLGAALPLGIISRCEVADVWLEEPRPLKSIVDLLQEYAPEGLRFKTARQADPKESAIQNRILSAIYHIIWPPGDLPPDLQARIETLLDAPALERERRGKTYDLRPLIESVRMRTDPDGDPCMELHVCLQPGKTGRPDEVLRAMHIDPYQPDIIRVQFILSDDEMCA